MNVAVVSPEEVLFEGEATQVITRTTEGDVAFLADHAPFLGSLVEGQTRVYLADGSVREFFDKNADALHRLCVVRDG